VLLAEFVNGFIGKLYVRHCTISLKAAVHLGHMLLALITKKKYVRQAAT